MGGKENSRAWLTLGTFGAKRAKQAVAFFTKAAPETVIHQENNL